MCIFCNIVKQPDNYRALEDDTGNVIAILDGFPVTRGHMLFIPKRHVQSFFGLDVKECSEIVMMVHKWSALLSDEDPTITGFNFGANIGESAGQTVDHFHMHLIPRRDGDCEDPTGGIRHCVCNGRGNYVSSYKR